MIHSLLKKTPPIVFVTNTIHYAIGLEEIIPNYHIICGDDDPVVTQLKQRGISILSLTRETGQFQPQFTSTHHILNHPLTKNYLNKLQTPHLIYFKPLALIEKQCQANHWQFLMPAAKLSLPFENKLRFFDMIKSLSIAVPEYRIGMINTISYDWVCQELGCPFVVQVGFSFAGNGTFLIQNNDHFDKIKTAFPHKNVRLTRYIDGLTLTINGCVTRFGTVCSAPFYQITGIPELTSNPLGSCGNDWRTPPLSPITKKAIIDLTRNIGDFLSKKGYRGIFGVDVVVEREQERVFLIEINPRLVASIPIYTKLQLLTGEIPLLALHLLEYLGIDYQINLAESQEMYLQPKIGAQLIGRNISEQTISTPHYPPTGIYTGGVKIREGVSIADIQNENEYFWIHHGGRHEFGTGSEIYRQQFRKNIVNDDGFVNLKHHYLDRRDLP